MIINPTSGSGTVGGSTGATDNRVLRADGVGGSTLQNSAVTIDDTGNITTAAGVVLAFGFNNYGYSDGIGPWTEDSTTTFRLTNDVQGLSGHRTATWPNKSGTVAMVAEAFLAADVTNATTTFASTTLSVPVTTGLKYGFEVSLRLADSVAADGVKLDFNGGTATATNFRAHVIGHDSALALSTQVTALATAATIATFTGDGMLRVEGSFEPSSTGTFIPRFAKNSHTTGTATLYRGSFIRIWQM